MSEILNVKNQAMACFEKQGWPHRKQEAWKYTPTQLLQKQALDLAPNNTVLFNHKNIEGLHIELVTEKNFKDYQHFFHPDQQDSALLLLNHALWQNAWVIRVSKKNSVKESLHIKFSELNANQTHYTKFIFIVEAEASLQVIMDHSESAGFANTMIHTDLKAQAEITFLDRFDSNDTALHFVHHTINQSTRSTFNHYSLALQAKWLRYELNIHLNESYARCHLNGLYFGIAEQFIDYHLCVNHKAPHCQSSQLYKGVLADHARAVFNGKVIVSKHAQKTVSSQKNHNILLSDHAEIDTKPELEIYADDVLCAHGATVGALSSDALFYLTSRGIDPAQAKKILLEAFMQEIAVHCNSFEEDTKKWIAHRLTEVYWDQT